MNGRARAIVFLVGAVALAAIAMVWWKEPTTSAVGPGQFAASGLSASMAPAISITEHPTGAKAKLDYRSLVHESRDYRSLATRLLTEATAGNPDAQFYLADVLIRCADAEKMFFKRRGQSLNIDDALQWAAKRHLSVEFVQSMYERCQALFGDGSFAFGTSQEWLAQATAAGQPIAEATTAQQVFVQQLMKGSASAAGVPTQTLPFEVDPNLDAKQLLRDAVESRQPEVLFEIGEMQPLLDLSESDPDVERTNRLAWWLLACESGLDCTSSGDWIRTICVGDPSCSQYSGATDFVRAAAGALWPEVQSRAAVIQADLDAGRWDNLGLGRRKTAGS